jgi:exonuclease SbcD
MVRVLHFADLHLGVENYGRPDPATGLHTRLLDFLRSFDELVEHALSQAVDLVIFVGDAYKNRDPSPTHQREFARRIHRLAAASIPVCLVIGNHDIPHTAGRANTLDIFATLEVPNVYVGRRPATFEIPTASGTVQVIALPWIVRSHLLSREDFKDHSLSEIEELTLTKVENVLEKELERLNPDLPIILAAHGAVQGATYGSERSVMLGQELVYPSSMMKKAAFDYVALGHIHRHQVLREARPPIVYSGSVDRIDFGEEKEAKGFVIAEVEKGKAAFEFIPLTSTRRFVTIDVHADGADPMAQVQEAISAHNIQDAVVRLIIHTTVDKNRQLHDREIHKLLGDAFKVATVVRDVQRVSRLRLGTEQNIAQMAPLQALEMHLQLKQVPKERIDRLLEYAQRLMTSGA